VKVALKHISLDARLAIHNGVIVALVQNFYLLTICHVQVHVHLHNTLKEEKIVSIVIKHSQPIVLLVLKLDVLHAQIVC